MCTGWKPTSTMHEELVHNIRDYSQADQDRIEDALVWLQQHLIKLANGRSK